MKGMASKLQIYLSLYHFQQALKKQIIQIHKHTHNIHIAFIYVFVCVCVGARAHIAN